MYIILYCSRPSTVLLTAHKWSAAHELETAGLTYNIGDHVDLMTCYKLQLQT